MAETFLEPETISDPQALIRAQQLCIRADVLATEISAAQALLDSKQAELNAILKDSLPEAMKDARISEQTMDSGRRICRKEIISGNWPKPEEPERVKAALEWLEKENLQDLLKVDVGVSFDRRQRLEALRLINVLQEEFAQQKFALREHVHHQTLNATFRERLKKGLPVPEEPFKLFHGHVAVIEDEKKGK